MPEKQESPVSSASLGSWRQGKRRPIELGLCVLNSRRSSGGGGGTSSKISSSSH